jgi:hypothetical protein
MKLKFGFKLESLLLFLKIIQANIESKVSCKIYFVINYVYPLPVCLRSWTSENHHMLIPYSTSLVTPGIGNEACSISYTHLILSNYLLDSASIWSIYPPACLRIYLSTSLPLCSSTVLLLDHGRVFSFLILHTVGRTPWTRDQPVARSLTEMSARSLPGG